MFRNQIAVIGGGGHVGLPLSLKFADKGFRVIVIDNNIKILDKLRKGILPYYEKGAKKVLVKLIRCKKIIFTDDYSKVSNARFIIITVGTPLNNQNKPNMKYVYNVINNIQNFLNSKQSIILRSTLFPGTINKIIKNLKKKKIKCKVSYCPERVAQGKSLEEIEHLTQIISSEDEKELKKIKKFFKKICKKISTLSFTEAEYSKLFSNAWRYIKFAVSNEFYMLSIFKKFDFNKVYYAMTNNYPRNLDLPKQGFAGGPCLPKDAMQLYSSSKKFSSLILDAYKINQNLPNFLVNQFSKKNSFKNKKIGVLGTAFKGNIDDERNSLSIKLVEILKKKGAKVHCHDPFIDKENYFTLNQVLKNCKIIFIGAPHNHFKNLKLTNKTVIDCWNFI